MSWLRWTLRRDPIRWRAKTGAMPADIYGSPDDKRLFVGLTGSDSVGFLT